MGTTDRFRAFSNTYTGLTPATAARARPVMPRF